MIVSLEYNLKSSTMMSTSFDETVKIWDISNNPKTNNAIHTYKDFNFSEERNLVKNSFNYNGNLIAIG